MKPASSSFLSFLLLLVWSSLGFAALIPPTYDDAIDAASHDKRGGVVSKPSKVYDTIPTIPTVAQLVLQVKKDRIVAKHDSLFYSRLGGASAQAKAMTWHEENVQTVNGHKTKARLGVTFDNVVKKRWMKSQSEVVHNLPGRVAKMNQFQRRLSQAFAEVANDKVYFFTAAGLDGKNLPLDTTWAAFEYPALTRNPAVTEIIQVSMTGNKGVAKSIWKHGDAPTANAPVGDGPVPAAPSTSNHPTSILSHRPSSSKHHPTAKSSHGAHPTAKASHHPTVSSPHRGRPTAKPTHRGRPTAKPSQKGPPMHKPKASRP